ncbi:ABC transporter ATP-binding protein [Rhodocyclaceae bacterium SMB388]
MFVLDRLCKRFQPEGEALFHDVSLAILPGECVAIMGESGVGKSTLLNCIAGLETIDGGRIELERKRIDGLSDDAWAVLRRRRYGFVFQAFHILPHLSLADNVALPLWLLDEDTGSARARALAMLAAVGLGGRADEGPGRLSGGELQRVAIARALVHRPAVVLADEPTGNLDPDRAGEVLALLLDTVRDAGAVGILVTHSPVAARQTDRILQLTRNGMREVVVE